MKRITILVVLLLTTLHIADAQEEQKSRTISLSYGYMGCGFTQCEPIIGNTTIPTQLATGNTIMLDADIWRINKYLTAGFYIGLGPGYYKKLYDNMYESNSYYSIETIVSVRYGLSANLHLLSLFGIEGNEVDLSIKGRFGGYWTLYQTIQPEYSIGISFAYYPIECLGIVLENSWGKYTYSHSAGMMVEGNSMLNAGLIYRF
jgi:hypothetical protein